MANEAKDATIVKKDSTEFGRKIQVYRLKEGSPTPAHIWCEYLGDNITMAKVNNNEHQKTYTEDELDIKK